MAAALLRNTVCVMHIVMMSLMSCPHVIYIDISRIAVIRIAIFIICFLYIIGLGVFHILIYVRVDVDISTC